MTDLKKAIVALRGADLERLDGPELHLVIRDVLTILEMVVDRVDLLSRSPWVARP